MSRRRSVVAFLLSPVVGAFTFLAVWLAWLAMESGISRATGEQTEVNWTETLQFLAVLFGFPLIIGYVAEIVLGWPLLATLRRRQRLSSLDFAAGGLVIGLVIALVLYWDDPASVPGVALCVVPAVVAALFFGWVGDWERGSEAPEDEEAEEWQGGR